MIERHWIANILNEAIACKKSHNIHVEETTMPRLVCPNLTPRDSSPRLCSRTRLYNVTWFKWSELSEAFINAQLPADFQNHRRLRQVLHNHHLRVTLRQATGSPALFCCTLNLQRYIISPRRPSFLTFLFATAFRVAGGFCHIIL